MTSPQWFMVFRNCEPPSSVTGEASASSKTRSIPFQERFFT